RTARVHSWSSNIGATELVPRTLRGRRAIAKGLDAAEHLTPEVTLHGLCARSCRGAAPGLAGQARLAQVALGNAQTDFARWHRAGNTLAPPTHHFHTYLPGGRGRTGALRRGRRPPRNCRRRSGPTRG